MKSLLYPFACAMVGLALSSTSQADIVISAEITENLAMETDTTSVFDVVVRGRSDSAPSTRVSEFDFGLAIVEVGSGTPANPTFADLSYTSDSGSVWSESYTGGGANDSTFIDEGDNVSTSGSTVSFSATVFADLVVGNEGVEILTSDDPMGTFQFSLPKDFSSVTYELQASVGAGEGFFVAESGSLTEVSSNADSYSSDSFTVSAVPEPSSLCLLSVGGLAIVGFRRRR